MYTVARREELAMTLTEFYLLFHFFFFFFFFCVDLNRPQFLMFMRYRWVIYVHTHPVYMHVKYIVYMPHLVRICSGTYLAETSLVEATVPRVVVYICKIVVLTCPYSMLAI